MTTPIHHTMHAGTGPEPADTPSTLRLRLAPTNGVDRLDGGWWPRSRNLGVELADLVDHFPPEAGRIMRALYSPADWDVFSLRVLVARGTVPVGPFPRGDTHVIDLYSFDRTTIRLLVVPHEFTQSQGDEALLAASTPGNAHSADDLLDHVTDQPDVDPTTLWRTADTAWWASDVEAGRGTQA